MLCAGTSIGILVAGRILQGISAAVVWTVGLALLVDTVDRRHIGTAMGTISLSMSVAILIAPLLGGVVYAKGGYYAVFAMSFALIGFDIVMRLCLIEKKIARKWIPDEEPDEEPAEQTRSPDGKAEEKTDGKNNVEGTPTVVLPNAPNAISLADPTGSPNFQQVDLNAIETPKKRMKLPPMFTLLANPRMLVALYGCLMQASLMTAFDSVLPLFASETFGWGSTGGGLLFLPLVLPSFTSPLVGHLSDKLGPRWFAAGGFVFMMPFLVLLRLVDHDSLRQIVLLCALLALIGVALTLIMPGLMAEITHVVSLKEAASIASGGEGFGEGGAMAQAYGLFNTAFAGGCLVGPIWSGFIKERAGWATMGWTLGLLSATTALPVLFYTGGKLSRASFKGRELPGAHEEQSGEVVV
jgi:MFS family permease